jgi:hypothetical protein
MFSFCSSRPLHHLTSFASPFAASEERCAQRARSRQQRISLEPSRLAYDLMSSISQTAASFSSAFSGYFSRGFRTAKIGEHVAAAQHILPRALSRDTQISHHGSSGSSSLTCTPSPAVQRGTTSPSLSSLLLDPGHFYSTGQPTCDSTMRRGISRRRLGASRQDDARAGSARREIVDSRNDDVDANLVRPQGASR